MPAILIDPRLNKALIRGLSADLSTETGRYVIVSSRRSNIAILLILMGHRSWNPLEIIHVTITMIYADVYLICPTQMYTGTRIIWALCGLKYYTRVLVYSTWCMIHDWTDKGYFGGKKFAESRLSKGFCFEHVGTLYHLANFPTNFDSSLWNNNK